MESLGRILVVVGVVLILVGLAVWGLGRLGLRGLPGDLRYEGENVRIHVPIVTSILLSILLTAILWVWGWLVRK